MVNVRPATSDDLNALIQIWNATIASGDTLVYSDPITPERLRYFLEESMTTYVAEADGVVLGGYTLRANQPGRGGHVCNAVYVVDPAARRRGVGRALGEHSLDQARLLGFSAMQFNAVVATNTAALKLWRSLGFTVVGTIPEAFHHKNGTFVDLLVMWRAL